jgi:hypothetical protein
MKRFRGVNFEARDYSSIVRGFSPQNHKLIGCYRTAISNLWRRRARLANRIKGLGSPRTPLAAALAALSAALPRPRTLPSAALVAPALPHRQPLAPVRTPAGYTTHSHQVFTPRPAPL